MKMNLNSFGDIVESTMKSLMDHHPVNMGPYQIMPNHVHFILEIVHKTNEGASRRAPTLGMMVGFLKSESTKQIRSVGATRGSPSLNNTSTVWQRNYWEHIIRNDMEYFAINQYILDNPSNWEKDKLFQCQIDIRI